MVETLMMATYLAYLVVFIYLVDGLHLTYFGREIMFFCTWGCYLTAWVYYNTINSSMPDDAALIISCMPLLLFVIYPVNITNELLTKQMYFEINKGKKEL